MFGVDSWIPVSVPHTWEAQHPTWSPTWGTFPGEQSTGALLGERGSCVGCTQGTVGV